MVAPEEPAPVTTKLCPKGHSAQFEPDKQAWYCWGCGRYVRELEVEAEMNAPWSDIPRMMPENEQVWWHRALSLIGKFLMNRKEERNDHR